MICKYPQYWIVTAILTISGGMCSCNVHGRGYYHSAVVLSSNDYVYSFIIRKDPSLAHDHSHFAACPLDCCFVRRSSQMLMLSHDVRSPHSHASPLLSSKKDRRLSENGEGYPAFKHLNPRVVSLCLSRSAGCVLPGSTSSLFGAFSNSWPNELLAPRCPP